MNLSVLGGIALTARWRLPPGVTIVARLLVVFALVMAIRRRRGGAA